MTGETGPRAGGVPIVHIVLMIESAWSHAQFAKPVAAFNATPGDTGLDPAPMAGSAAAAGSLAVLYERRQRE